MNSIVVEVGNNKYLVKYKILKSVVNRKHTTKEGKIINRLELHPNSCLVYLHKIIKQGWHLNILSGNPTSYQELEYLGRGLSKCSDKDKFDKNKGIRQAIANIKELDSTVFNVFLAHDINYKILNTKL